MIIIVVVIMVAAGGFALWWYEPFRPGPAPCAPSPAPLTPSTDRPQPPGSWPRHCDGIPAVLAKIDIPEVNPYQEDLHLHAHLRIVVHGEELAVPAGIGIAADLVPVSPLHTHTPDGLVHVESPVVRPYTWVQFMAVWGVRLSADCLGGYCTGADGTLIIYVDDRRWDRPITQLEIAEKQSVTILYGTTEQTAPGNVRQVDWSRWDV